MVRKTSGGEGRRGQGAELDRKQRDPQSSRITPVRHRQDRAPSRSRRSRSFASSVTGLTPLTNGTTVRSGQRSGHTAVAASLGGRPLRVC